MAPVYPCHCCLYQSFSSTSLLFYLEGEGSSFFETIDTLPHPQCNHLWSRIIVILEPWWQPYINSVYNCSLYIELKTWFYKVLNSKVVILLLYT
jgi:hypothetical protein